MKTNKKVIIINIVAIFLCMFLFSFIYKLIPNFFTAFFFPVNESLFEHLKLMYSTITIVSLITFIVLKIKKISIKNYFFGLTVSTIINIVLYFLIYIPLYNRFGENIIFNMGLFLLTLLISHYVFYLILNIKENDIYNILAIILIPFIWSLLAFLTFNPKHTDFFFDTIKEKYGLNDYIKND